jgi:hypothetical protein
MGFLLNITLDIATTAIVTTDQPKEYPRMGCFLHRKNGASTYTSKNTVMVTTSIAWMQDRGESWLEDGGKAQGYASRWAYGVA